MATDDGRKAWPIDREAYDKAARLLAEKFPDMNTYRAQVQVLDENLKLRAALTAIIVHGHHPGYDNNWAFYVLDLANKALKSCYGVTYLEKKM